MFQQLPPQPALSSTPQAAPEFSNSSSQWLPRRS
uniref:Uncharacterized protein n=1 Tax=Arundo donax TaxID=35708 RepID=A0A0A9UHS2_ARUDO